MLSPRTLADQYLQRYREKGDIGDVLAGASTWRKLSLKAQPNGNIPAMVALASVYLTLHKFYQALALTKYIETQDPGDKEMPIREASLDLEVGRYGDAKQHHRSSWVRTRTSTSRATRLRRATTN